jgi:orotate phosphoribosyltransferase
VTTGLSTRETMEVAREAGATVVAAGAIVDRSSGAAGLGVAFTALMQLAIPTYQPEVCPLCAAGQAVVKPGSRA